MSEELAAEVVARVAACQSERDSMRHLLRDVLDHRVDIPVGDTLVVLTPDIVARIQDMADDR